MITNTTSIFRMKFENYPELRNELRLKVAKKVFDKIFVGHLNLHR